jgi:hypothetical protein
MKPEVVNSKDSMGGDAKSKALAQNLKDIVAANAASMAKDFHAIEPRMYGMGPMSPTSDINYPEISLPLKDVLEAKDWKVGNRYGIELVVEMTGLTDRIGSGGRVEFSVIGIKPGDEIAKPKEVTDAETKVEDGEDQEGGPEQDDGE